jgi:hypothetical protein
LREKILASKHEIAKLLAEKKKREESLEHASVSNILARIEGGQPRQTKLQALREKSSVKSFA